MNFYFEAAKILDRIDAKHGSIKGILAEVNEKSRKRTAAAVIRTLEYKPVLTSILTASELLKHEKRLIPSLNLALLLVHDLLFAKGIQAGDGPIKQAVLKHKTRLHSELVKLKIKKGVKSDRDLAKSEDARAESIPRYVRVNRNLATVPEVVKLLAQDRRLILSPNLDDPDPKHFALDPHIPDLLVFHPSVTFHSDPLYLSGRLILQDKASCLPAAILAPPKSERTVAIDATAAPGNKTSHLSALMGNIGKVFAFERDKRRYGTLEKMLKKAECQNVSTFCMDFLETDPEDERFKDVTHMLLDPSCSGSGIVNRLDYLVESSTGAEEADEQEAHTERLAKLAEFQLKIILHAMKFPSVQKIAYSTCSVHPEEDEHVVRQVLTSLEATLKNFGLAPREDVLPAWHRRGRVEDMASQKDAESLIRTLPGEDRTNGFFVALFVRQDQKRGSKRARDEGEDDDLDKGDLDDAGGEKDIQPSQKKKAKKKGKKKKKSKGTGGVAA